MGDVPVVFETWVWNEHCWFFRVDNVRGGRMFNLHDGCTHGELMEMAIEDYLLHTKSDSVELSYALPDEMLKQMPPNTPPMTVSNDRQVRTLMEFCKSNIVRLCVSIRKVGSGVGAKSGVNDMSLSHYEDNMEDKREERVDVEFEDDDEIYDEHEDGSGAEGEDEVDNLEEKVVDVEDKSVLLDENEEDAVYDTEEDYSLYGKLEDEDEDKPDVPFDANTITAAEEWCDTIEVGKSYPSKNALISEVRLTAVHQKFAFKSSKSNKTVLVANCVVQGC